MLVWGLCCGSVLIFKIQFERAVYFFGQNATGALLIQNVKKLIPVLEGKPGISLTRPGGKIFNSGAICPAVVLIRYIIATANGLVKVVTQTALGVVLFFAIARATR